MNAVAGQAGKAIWRALEHLRGSLPHNHQLMLLMALFGVRLAEHTTRRQPSPTWDEVSAAPITQVRQALLDAAQSLLSTATEAGDEIIAVLQGILFGPDPNDASQAVWLSVAELSDVDVPTTREGALAFSREVSHAILEAAADDKQLGPLVSHRHLNDLIAAIAAPRARLNARRLRLFDPTMGAASTLCTAAREIQARHPHLEAEVCGQDSNLNAVYFAAWNLLLNGTDQFSIKLGDSLREPRFLDAQGGRLAQFDLVVSTPPIGSKLKPEELSAALADPYNRFSYGVPKGSADWLFIQHSLASTKPQGTAIVATSLGALTRSGIEAELRAHLAHAGTISAVVQLPGRYIADSSVQSALLVLEPAPSRAARDILMVDCSVLPPTGQSGSGDSPVEPAAIADLVQHRLADVQGSRLVSLQELAKEGYNLSPARYILPPISAEDLPPVDQVESAIHDARWRLRQSLDRFDDALSELSGLAL